MSASATAAPRLVHFTPLRYPGGKGKLAAFVKALITDNGLLDGHYIEPYAGGAAIALELLLQEYVAQVHLNDISIPVHAFWSSVLNQTEELVRLVRDTKLTLRSWDRQKAIFREEQDDKLALGFAMFFLNRTNRSGILNGGVIGGRDQTGKWKIDARYNAKELAHRIESIARLRHRISLSREDAIDFIVKKSAELPPKSLFYLDPPYYAKGKALYFNYYSPKDHAKVASAVKGIRRQRWIVSYDCVPEVERLYPRCERIKYTIGYSARDIIEGSEVMFFSNGLKIPALAGSMRPAKLPM